MPRRNHPKERKSAKHMARLRERQGRRKETYTPEKDEYGF